MASTISTKINHGVTLGTNGYTNPLSITNTGYIDAPIGNAVYGPQVGYAWTVNNDGTIAAAGGAGIYFNEGGVVTNASHATISGLTGVTITGGLGTITNDGIIAAHTLASDPSAGIVGVDLFSGGTITNTGSISAYLDGVKIGDGEKNGAPAGTLINSGTIRAIGIAGAGVYLDDGGTLTNHQGGYISAAGTNAYGVAIYNGLGTVINDGIIKGLDTFSHGVALKTGGSVTNDKTGTISGVEFGVTIAGTTGIVTNYGLISATNTYGDGILLNAGGGVTNQAGGLVTAGFGVAVYGAAGTITNDGSITASNGAGVILNAGGDVTNNQGAVIQANGYFTSADNTTSYSYGVVFFGGGGTVTDAGAINAAAAGPGGNANKVVDAVKFLADYTNLLTVDPGASFRGIVDGGNAVGGADVSTLELAAGSSSGTITGFGTSFVNFGSIQVDSGASWDFAGSTTIVSGITVTNDGTIHAGSGDTLTIDGAVGAGLSQSGVISLANGATVGLDGSVSSAETIAFNDASVLTIANPASVTAPITGFIVADTIDLTNLPYNSSDKPVYQGGVLDIEDASNDILAQLTLSGEPYTSASFMLSPDAGTTPGTDITTDTPCFCPGTMILTPSGEVAVERLQIGALVVTQTGEAKPIRWIGRRSYAGRFIAGQRNILPVCIKAGALGDGVPRRDLWVSPRHAMFLDGMLIPSMDLVNGVSVVQADRVQEVHYIHLELAEHDVIWAEGAASETFIDDESRDMFQNAHEFHVLYPDAVRVPALYCAPRLEDGYALEAIRQRIAERAGLLRQQAPLRPLRGQIDLAQGDRVNGWAQDTLQPEVPVCLDVLVDGVLVTQVLANRYRADLQAAGLGSGRHSFVARLPSLLPGDRRSVIEVRRSADQAALACSPLVREIVTPTKTAA